MTGLELEGFRLFPGKALVRKVSILGSPAVDWVGQVQLLDDDTWPEIEVRVDDLDELVTALLTGAVRLHEHGQGLSDTDGVGELDEGPAGELAVHKRLGDPACEIGGRAVDFTVVLTREGTAAVRAPAAVGVDNDLAARQTGIALWTADDEEARRLDLSSSANSSFPHSARQLSGDGSSE